MEKIIKNVSPNKEYIRNLLLKNPNWWILCLKDLQEKAKKSSKNTINAKAIVLAFAIPYSESHPWRLRVFQNKNNATVASIIGIGINHFFTPKNIVSFEFFGFLRIISGSLGSVLSAIAGEPSVAKFMYRICFASKGDGHPITIAKVSINNSLMLADNR